MTPFFIYTMIVIPFAGIIRSRFQEYNLSLAAPLDIGFNYFVLKYCYKTFFINYRNDMVFYYRLSTGIL
jgi:hypothetical protein